MFVRLKDTPTYYAGPFTLLGSDITVHMEVANYIAHPVLTGRVYISNSGWAYFPVKYKNKPITLFEEPLNFLTMGILFGRLWYSYRDQCTKAFIVHVAMKGN